MGRRGIGVGGFDGGCVLKVLSGQYLVCVEC